MGSAKGILIKPLCSSGALAHDDFREITSKCFGLSLRTLSTLAFDKSRLFCGQGHKNWHWIGHHHIVEGFGSELWLLYIELVKILSFINFGNFVCIREQPTLTMSCTGPLASAFGLGHGQFSQRNWVASRGAVVPTCCTTHFSILFWRLDTGIRQFGQLQLSKRFAQQGSLDSLNPAFSYASLTYMLIMFSLQLFRLRSLANSSYSLFFVISFFRPLFLRLKPVSSPMLANPILSLSSHQSNFRLTCSYINLLRCQHMCYQHNVLHIPM